MIIKAVVSAVIALVVLWAMSMAKASKDADKRMSEIMERR